MIFGQQLVNMPPLYSFFFVPLSMGPGEIEATNGITPAPGGASFT
jgi:hypothetical protein